MMEVTIHKHRLTGNFTQISNAIIEDTRLSNEAFRLLSWMLHSHPDKEHCFDEWQEVIGAGIRKLKKVLSELVELGYLKQDQKRNEYGQFMRTEYQFFDSSSQEKFTVCPKPSDGSCKDTYYNNTSGNTGMSVSVLSYPETEQNETVETVEMPVENSESTEDLTDCITSSLNEIIDENAELKGKFSLILDMHDFMQNLTEIIKTALLRLKHPEAKGTFIKNTIIHILEKVKAKKQEPTPKPEKSVKKVDKPTPLTDTLALIGSQLVEKSFIDEEDPDCESIEYFYNFPLHIMQEDIQNCTLPYSLQGDKKAMRDAIQYVTCYSYDRYEHGYKEAKEDISFRYFMGAVVDSLTEIITTERVGKRVVHYYEYIDKINQIIRISGNLYGFVVDFEYYFRRLLEAKAAEGEPVRNQKRYLNVVLSDFLISYNANQIIPTWCGEL
jgi:hypothetical protein